MTIKYPKLVDSIWLEKQLNTKSTRLIAKELGCHYSLINYTVKKFGIRIPKRKKYFGWISKDEKIRISKEAYKKKYPKGRFGDKAGNWKGGRRIANQSGYVYIYKPKHPSCTKEGYVMEHRLKMEKKLGRYLKYSEIVHHRNGIKNDNRLCNLIVTDKKKHSKKHFGAVKLVDKLKFEVKRLRKILEDSGIKY